MRSDGLCLRSLHRCDQAERGHASGIGQHLEGGHLLCVDLDASRRSAEQDRDDAVAASAGAAHETLIAVDDYGVGG